MTSDPDITRPLAVTDDPLLGQLVDERYTVTRLISRGGMGHIYAAQEVNSGAEVALKILLRSYVNDRETAGRFRREARAAAQIGHDHIVRVFDFGPSPAGGLYMAMELLDGEDLTKVLRAAGAMPWARARPILQQAAGALGAAHEHGVVHRDVKPSNIFLVKDHPAGDPFVKLLDFGIAKLNEPADSIVTSPGSVLGTPHFMAPEQTHGGAIDHRADIYSLGAVAYSLITGTPPFTGKNLVDVMQQHAKAPVVPPSERNSGHDAPWVAEAAIIRALAKKGEDRQSSMAEFADALNASR